MKKIFIMLIIVMVVLTACQPTPEDNAVQSKAGDELMETISEGVQDEYEVVSVNQVLGIEESLLYLDSHYENEYTDSTRKIIINIDADVYMPVEEKIPVAKVERVEFSQETVDRVINLFAKGEAVYKTYLTSDMLEEQILEIQQRIAGYDENETNTMESLEAQLEYLIKEINNIDEDMKLVSFDISQTDEIIYGQYLTQNEEVAHIVIDATKDNLLGQRISIGLSGDFISVNRYCENNSLINLSEEQLKKITLGIDYNTALEAAVNLVETLGISGMALYSTDIAIPSQYDLWTDEDNADGGYIFEFRRAINNVPSSDIIYIQEYMEGELGYSPIWKDEKITIIVDERGIVEFIWQSPSNVVEILNEDVEVMSFEESIDIAMQQMSNSLWCHDGIISQTLNINEITLNLARVKIKDSNEEYMLIPVWKFYGDLWIKYTEEYLAHPDAPSEDMQSVNEDGALFDGNKLRPYLTLNAIDGTVIDPYTGY